MGDCASKRANDHEQGQYYGEGLEHMIEQEYREYIGEYRRRFLVSIAAD